MYNHKKIEQKWRKKWEDSDIYKTSEDPSKEKYYILDMFPYPSGAGLHVGHPKGFIATDIFARFKKMQGFNVLHPMGWDAFGLPAENFALKNKTHPRIQTKENVDMYKSQLDKLGFSYDWDREINTTDPEFYKWTQWTFLKMFEKGLAYESYEPIIWCPKCKTGLANEDLEGDKCERCDTLVEKKPMRQWVLKITNYADRMLEDLDKLPNWDDSIREMQRNWIGRSVGAEVKFKLKKEQNNSSIKKIYLATGNESKLKRMKKMFARAVPGLIVEQVPELIDVEENGKDGWENSQQKVEVYKGKYDYPVFAGDTAIAIQGENFDPTHVKRAALEGINENDLTQEEIATKMKDFYTNIARKNGGEKDFYFEDFWSLLMPDGEIIQNNNIRECLLTDRIHHKIDIFFPLMSLYISKKTGKNPYYHTDKEHWLEFDSLLNSFRDIIEKGSKYDEIKVFTTRPDTLFGCTYMVLSPEHKLVQKMKDSIENFSEVEEYIKKVGSKSDLERTDLAKEKTGIELKGIKAINPVNNKEVPVWIADYVLATYGTGAIMAVPAHDERDFEFAEKYGIEIKQVVAPMLIATGEDKPKSDLEFVKRKTIVAIVKHNKEDKYICLKWTIGWKTFVVGGVKDDESYEEAAIREVREETGYKNLKLIKKIDDTIFSKAFARHKNLNRLAEMKAFLFELEDEEVGEVKAEDVKFHDFEWVEKDKISEYIIMDSQYYYWDKLVNNKVFTEDGVNINSNFLNDLNTKQAKEKIITWLEERNLGKESVNYKLNDWVFSRQRYWGEPIPIIHCSECKKSIEKNAHSINFYNQKTWDKLIFGKKTVETRALNPEEKNRYFGDIVEGNYLKAVNKENNEEQYFKVKKVNKYQNLAEFFEDKEVMKKTFAPDKIPETIAELEQVYYFVEDYVERINKNGLIAWEIEFAYPGIVGVPEKDLPVKLPDVEKYEPTGTGESPLAGIDEWVNVKCPKCGSDAKRETNTMPQWAGSSWYYLRFIDPKNNDELINKEKDKYWSPVDFYVGGAEHATRHLIYARFWHKFLYDIGVVNHEEPFTRLQQVGLVLAEDGRKMSKRWGNVINPDDVVEEFGADAMRLYEMFMSPFSQACAWSTKGLVGTRRFLEKVIKLSENLSEDVGSNEVEKLLHKTIKKVTEDINEFKFNTAISQMMILVNKMLENKINKTKDFEDFLKLLASFTPHLAEELWEELGHKTSILDEKWPIFDEKLIIDQEFELIIQINGKIRDKVMVSMSMKKNDIEKMALERKKVQSWTKDKDILKLIFIPGKLINIVVK